MKTFNLISLYNSEIRKSNLSNIRGGSDIKCACGTGSPAVTVYQQAPSENLCLCPDGPNYSSTKNKTGNGIS